MGIKKISRQTVRNILKEEGISPGPDRTSDSWKEFSEYYNHHRSHMSRDHLPPVRDEPDEVEKLGTEQVEVKSYVGGLVKVFERKAA